MTTLNNKIKVGVIIVKGDEVLLIKEKLKKNPLPLWNIIKGSYGDHAPETIFAAAIREAKEEAGLDIKINKLLGVYVSQLDDCTWTQFTFIAEMTGGTQSLADSNDQAAREEDIMEIKWFSKADVSQMKSSEIVSDRTYQIIQDWLKAESYPLSAVRQL